MSVSPEAGGRRPVAPARRARRLGLAMFAVWSAAPVLAGAAFYTDDWRPLAALVPLLIVDSLLYHRWLDAGPEVGEEEAAETFAGVDEEELEELADGGWSNDLLFALDHPEVLNRVRYRYRGELVLRSIATVLQPVGWVLLVVSLPEHPGWGAFAAVLIVSALGSSPSRMAMMLHSRFRVRTTEESRARWVRRDELVERLAWAAVAIFIVLSLTGVL